MYRYSCFIAALLVCLSGIAQGENTPESRAKLAADGKFPEAYAAYKEALGKDPKNPALLFNTGLMAYLAGKPKDSIDPWTQLKGLFPEDIAVRAKLIQAHEALGQKKERDAERDALLAMRKKSTDAEVKETKFYCRDQFTVGKTRLMVFEYFELEGDKAVRLSFNVLSDDEENPISMRYSLGSYEMTNAIAQESGRLKAGERLYHLDAYRDKGATHELYEMYDGEPTYDKVKAAVVEVIEGKRKPQSSSSRKPAK